MRIRTLLLTVTLLLPLAGSAVVAQQADIATLRQTAAENPLGVKPSFSPSSLLDASRFSWSHSYSISFFSGNNSSLTTGLLNSTMHYQLSPSLSLAFNIGILHNAGSLFNRAVSTDATFLPGFALDYRPSNKFHLSLQVQRISGLAAPQYGPGGAYRYAPWDFTTR